MRERKTTLWITQTAILIALLIIIQIMTSSMGNTLVTGSCVNCLLVISVMICGLKTGLWVAVLSPVVAKLLGIGPLWSLIPIIVMGNSIFVFIWHQSRSEKSLKKRTRCCVALIAAAFTKFLVLYIGVVKIVLPVFLDLPQKQVNVISHLFSVPQLITALAGGGLALMVLPVLIKKSSSEFNP